MGYKERRPIPYWDAQWVVYYGSLFGLIFVGLGSAFCRSLFYKAISVGYACRGGLGD